MSKRFKPNEEVWVRATFSHHSGILSGWVYVTPANYGGSGPIGMDIKNVVKLPTVRTPREGVPEPAIAQSDKKDAARYRRLIAILTGGYGLSVGKDASIRLDDAFEERITSDQITKAIDSDMGDGVPEKAKKKARVKK